MGKKIAVAIIHGIGRQNADFAEKIIKGIRKRCPDCADDFEFGPVYWAPIFEETEARLWDRTSLGGKMRWMRARRLMVYLIGDAVAYQITSKKDDEQPYNRIHRKVADTLKGLAERTDDNAPLVIIAHSLGSIIASNFIYDMQNDQEFNAVGKPLVPDLVRDIKPETPLEQCKTLTHLFTLGSPLALWSLRYKNFSSPINIPSPDLDNFHPELKDCGKWFNFYDRDDAIGYPIKYLNDEYAKEVTRDVDVNVGEPPLGWTPMSHTKYWSSPRVHRDIAAELLLLHRAING